MRRLKYGSDLDCWALSLYVTQIDFDAYHVARGEACDYAAMHSSMMLTSGNASSSIDAMKDIVLHNGQLVDAEFHHDVQIQHTTKDNHGDTFVHGLISSLDNLFD